MKKALLLLTSAIFVSFQLSAQLSVTVTTTNALCGNCDGTASALPSGGVPPYSYQWDAAANFQTAAIATGLCAGTYTVTVTDAVNSTAVGLGTVSTAPPLLAITIPVSFAACGCDGEASVFATGGTSPYTYLWSDPGAQTDSLATGLCAGNYTVTVTDNNNCTAVDFVTIIFTGTGSTPICVITVDNSSTKNIIVWEKPVTTAIDSFRIYRDVVGNYVHIASQPYSALSVFEDSTAGVNPQVTSYRYKISQVDTCGNDTVLSAHHETIHLTASPGTGSEINLIWDGYEGFGFNYYRILRDSTLLNNWEVIDSVSNANFTYTDLTPPPNSRFVIEIVMDSSCNPTMSPVQVTRSNVDDITTSVEEKELIGDQLHIYPNPTTGKFSIQGAGVRSQHVQVFDLLGNLVYAQSNPAKQEPQSGYSTGQATNKRQVDMSTKPKGVYIVKAGEAVRKLILQ